jgi:hypothetical protein
MMDANYLLNAPDGIARLEAHRALQAGDPAVEVPRLVKMLEEGTARFPQEILDSLETLGGREVVEKLVDHTDPTIRAAAQRYLSRPPVQKPDPVPKSAPVTPPPRRERTEEEVIDSWIKWLGVSLKIDKAREEHAHRKLVEIGAPAVPVLVRHLHDPAARKQRFAILQVLGEIGAQGVDEALQAVKAASADPDPGISGPAGAVLRKMGIDG